MPAKSQIVDQGLFVLNSLAVRNFIFLAIFIIVILAIIITYIRDVTQKQQTILRNYPVIGHLRYIAEELGVYLRSYFFSNDREELPFNRAERSWVYRAAKNVENVISFGSTRNLKPVGTVFFVDAPFPVLGQDAVKTK